MVAKTLLLASLLFHAAQGQPGYVMCPDVEKFPSTTLVDGKLSVFAASMTNRWSRGLVLHLALMWDDGSEWKPHLPCQECKSPNLPFREAVANISYIDARRLSRMSPEEFASPEKKAHRLRRYAKCFGAALPANTLTACRFGEGGSAPPKRNATPSTGHVLRFSNGELQHEFVQCSLQPGRVRRWGSSKRGYPERFLAELSVATPRELERRPADALPEDAPVIQIELCKVPRQMHRISFCTMPLYGMREIQQELPWAVDDWADYHLDFLGFDHGEIYDIDGSFEAVVRRRQECHNDSKITYHRRWPARLSEPMAAISRRHPSCTETWAYAHCLATHRALSRWLIILHSPDEYVGVRDHSLPAFVHKLGSRVDGNDPFGFLFVKMLAWARGGPGSVEARPGARGAAVAASARRHHRQWPGYGLIDPAVCHCAGPHMCYDQYADRRNIFVDFLPGDQIVVHHYLEMLERERGGCSHWSDQTCEVEDHDSSPLVPFLQFLLSSDQGSGRCRRPSAEWPE